MKMLSTSKTTLKPQTLPPTERAIYFHSLRVHYQVIEWKSLQNTSLNPTEWGWRLDQDTYEPIMTDLEPAPDNILKFIRCNCKLSKKNPCGTNVCTCRKHGLVCVSACGDCHGVDCENSGSLQDPSDAAVDDDDDDYDNIFTILENELL